jgi:hypothetical protein
LRLYDRFWTADEIRSAGEMVRTLHAEPTLFQVSARNAETVRHAGPLSLKMTRRGETRTVTSPDVHGVEQAFSEDGGKTWEPNFVATLTREH